VPILEELFLPLQAIRDAWIEVGHVTELPIEIPAVLLGDVVAVDVLFEDLELSLRGEDEDFRLRSALALWPYPKSIGWTYDSDRIEPALRPPPYRLEIRWSSHHKDPIQRLRVVRRGQLARVTHVIPQVKQLPKSNTGKIDNIVALAYGRLVMRPIGHCRAHGQDEAAQILVERKQLEHLPWCLAVCGLLPAVFAIRIHRHVFRVQIADLEDVEGDATLVSPPSPLWIQPACLFVLLDVDGLVQPVEIVLFAPVFRVFELGECLLWYKLSSSQISKEGLFIMRGWGAVITRVVVSLLRRQLLEFLERSQLSFAQVSNVSGRPLHCQGQRYAVHITNAIHLARAYRLDMN
jgi:hypothetical protein